MYASQIRSSKSALVATMLFASGLVISLPAKSEDSPPAAKAKQQQQNLYGNVEESAASDSETSKPTSLRIHRLQGNETAGATAGKPEAPALDTPSTGTPSLNGGGAATSLNGGMQKSEVKARANQLTKGGGLGLIGFYALTPSNHGSPCYITNVFPGSDLAQQGFQSGDLLTRIDGKSPFDFTYTAHSTSPGDKIELSIQHGEELRTVFVTRHDIREFVDDFKSYAGWATSHISFIKEHEGEFDRCELF